MFNEADFLNLETKRYRMLILNGTITYPIWSFLTSDGSSNGLDPIWQRLVISAILLILFFASYFAGDKRVFLQKSLIFGSWLLISHTAWICWQTHLSYPLLCGVLILACCLLNIAPTRLATLLLSSAFALVGATVALSDHQWLVPPLIVNIVLWAAVIPSASANLTRIKNLAALWISQNQTRAFFHNMTEGLVAFSSKQRILAINDSACKILGISNRELAGNYLESNWTCFSEEGRAIQPEDNPVAQIFTTRIAVKNQNLGVSRPDGSVAWIKLNATTVTKSVEETEVMVVLTFTDETERKKSQKVMDEQKARLDATAKMAALGEIAAGVAHEINNPLAIIEGKVFQIQKALSNPEKLAETLEAGLHKISATVFRIQKITKGLEAFSYGGNVEEPFVQVEFSDLLEDAMGFCHEKIKRCKVAVEIDCEKNIYFQCRPIQISQVLINLISNACDAIEAQDEPWLKVWARSAHNQLVITVTDSGLGIHHSLQEKIMQPFFTTKEVGHGTGLGLSISQGFLNSHLGRIWVDPTASHTCFVIELPLVQTAVPQPA